MWCCIDRRIPKNITNTPLLLLIHWNWCNSPPSENIHDFHDFQQAQTILIQTIKYSSRIQITITQNGSRKSYSYNCWPHYCGDWRVWGSWGQCLRKTPNIRMTIVFANCLIVSTFVSCCQAVGSRGWWWHSSVKMEFLSKTDHTTQCPWKGDASYYTINLDSKFQIFGGA